MDRSKKPLKKSLSHIKKLFKSLFKKPLYFHVDTNNRRHDVANNRTPDVANHHSVKGKLITTSHHTSRHLHYSRTIRTIHVGKTDLPSSDEQPQFCHTNQQRADFDQHVRSCADNQAKDLIQPFFEAKIFMVVKDYNSLLSYEAKLHAAGHDTMNCPVNVRHQIELLQSTT